MVDGRTEAAARAVQRWVLGDKMHLAVTTWVDYKPEADAALAAADRWDRGHGIVRTDRRTPDDAVIGYRVRVDGREYMLHPSDVDLVRLGAPQGEAQ
jgi:hypothetical protein